MNAGLRHLLCLAVVLAATAAVHAELVADRPVIDLGTRRESEPAVAEARLINVGKSALTILEVRADCACTVGALDKMRIEAGEATSLRVTVDPRGYRGMLRRSLHVLTTEGELVLPLVVMVSPYRHWMIDPATVIIPASRKGQEAAAVVNFTPTGSIPVALQRAECSAEWLRARIEGEDTGAPRVVLTKLSSAPAGSHTVKVKVETNAADEPVLSFDVFVSVASILKVEPNPVILATVKVGQRASRDIALRGWAGASAPRLELQRGTARATGHEEGVWHFEIAVDATAPGPFAQLMRIYDGDSLEAELPVITRAEPADKTK